jgi:hypothetical protein
MQNLRLELPYKGSCGKLITATFILAICLFSFTANSQSYSSNFPDPSGNFTATAPSGSGCLAPTLNNPSAIADADLNNYVSISGLINAPLTCTDAFYSIRAKLNFPSGTTFAPAGYAAGFRVQFSSVVSLSLLQSNITLRTYLAGTPRETINGATILNLSLLSGGGVVPLYFNATQTFDEVELVINSAVLPLNVGVDYRVYNAFGSIEVLPVSFGNVTATIKSGSLYVDWNTQSEDNNDKFIVQASSNGQAWTDLGTVVSKALNGKSSIDLKYSFSMPWTSTLMASFGVLGLLLMPAFRNRWAKVAIVLVAALMIASCAKERDGFSDLEKNGRDSNPVYVRVAQIDKDGKISYSQAVVAKR